MLKDFELKKDEDNFLSYVLDTNRKNIFNTFFPKENGLYTIIETNIYCNPFNTKTKGVQLNKGSRYSYYANNPYYHQE